MSNTHCSVVQHNIYASKGMTNCPVCGKGLNGYPDVEI